MKKIAIEEHFWTEDFVNYLFPRKDQEEMRRVPAYYRVNPEDSRKLLDMGEGRLRDMDEAGIDIQVLSLSGNVEGLDLSEGIAMARRINDELSTVVRKHPDRFAAFAVLAPQDPSASADELKRAVKELGMKGAKIDSHVKGEYLDDKKYWVIFEKAEELGVPIYLHPKPPPRDMLKPYLTYPALAGSMWGFGADAGLHAMRLVCSGVFDEYPGLKIILGHLGEALPYWLWRIDNRWLKDEDASSPLANKLKKKPSQYIKENFLVTTSGMHWQPALLCAYLALGADRILFAADYPFESSKEATQFMDAAPLCDTDREKIYHLNAEKFLAL